MTSRLHGAANPNWRGGRSKGTCASCGASTWRAQAKLCKRCYCEKLGQQDQTGPKNPNWADSPARGTGWWRAERQFGLGLCEECGKTPARDRHHLDDNPLNNDPSNVRRLCRRCHMILDGRMGRLIERIIERNRR